MKKRKFAGEPKCVETLQKIDIELKLREKKKVLTIKGTQLLGELEFCIDVDGNVDFPQIVFEKGATERGFQR